jgi:hypothetical protein
MYFNASDVSHWSRPVLWQNRIEWGLDESGFFVLQQRLSAYVKLGAARTWCNTVAVRASILTERDLARNGLSNRGVELCCHVAMTKIDSSGLPKMPQDMHPLISD